MKSTRITIKTSVLLAVATLLGSSIAYGTPAAAQTVAAKTNTQAYRNSLPPCATSSVDINICDLPFIRSQGGCSTSQCAPAVAPISGLPANNPVSSEYDQYLNEPTDSEMTYAMAEGSFDNPSAGAGAATSAPALQWTLNGVPCTSSSAGCGQMISSFGCGTAQQAGCGATQFSMPACQTSCGSSNPAPCGVQFTWSSGGQ